VSSTPQDRPGEDSPGAPDGPATGQQPPAPGAYGAAPPPPGAPPAPGQPYPYAQPQADYAYSPYGYPLGTGEADLSRGVVPRPGILILALVLLLLSAVPYLLFGVAALVAPDTPGTIPPDLLDDPTFAQAGITAETVVQFIRIVGGIFLAVALFYAALAVLAFTGRNWARITLAVLTGLFALLIGFGILSLALSGDVAGALVSALLLSPAVAGVILFFTRPANDWYRSR
jgi:heme A synthase